MWKCPECGRKFARKGQQHSCRTWPIENHFKNKEYAVELFEAFKKKVENEVGPFKVRSLHCCIHFVSSFSFLAVFPRKDSLRIHFVIDEKLESPRIHSWSKITKTNYKYVFYLKNEREMDPELMKWIKKAYALRKK